MGHPSRQNRLANATAIVPRPPCVRAASPHHRKLGAGFAALSQMAGRRFGCNFRPPLALAHDGYPKLPTPTGDYQPSRSLSMAGSEGSQEVAYGITSKTPTQASSAQVLRANREHWSIENSGHYIIDWNYDEDRSRIRKVHGLENMTRVRRYAVGIIKIKGVRSAAQKMRELTMNPRIVFDYLKMRHSPIRLRLTILRIRQHL